MPINSVNITNIIATVSGIAFDLQLPSSLLGTDGLQGSLHINLYRGTATTPFSTLTINGPIKDDIEAIVMLFGSNFYPNVNDNITVTFKVLHNTTEIYNQMHTILVSAGNFSVSVISVP